MTVPMVAVTRQAVIPGKPEAVFRFIAAEDVLPKVLTGYGPLPAVVGTSQRVRATRQNIPASRAARQRPACRL